MSKEEFEHDDCPKCGTASVPGEGVRDQALRGCPKCGEVWFEDLDVSPRKGAWNPEE
jgi:predicted  nucleic acid-binding Zn-ribbon protein